MRSRLEQQAIDHVEDTATLVEAGAEGIPWWRWLARRRARITINTLRGLAAAMRRARP